MSKEINIKAWLLIVDGQPFETFFTTKEDAVYYFESNFAPDVDKASYRKVVIKDRT